MTRIIILVVVLANVCLVTHTEATDVIEVPPTRDGGEETDVDCIEEPKECDVNEVLVNCTNACPSEYCPKTADEDQNCFSVQVCGPPACKCRLNYRRAANKTCIPTIECPPFDCSAKPFQKYDPCPPLCPDGSCGQARPDGQCPLGHIGIVLICRPQCRCIDDYFRNDNGDCVPYLQCPGKCPVNEVYSDCTQTVCNQNCSAAGKIFNCPLVKSEDCKKGCICKPDHYRLENGTCVPQDQCPETLTCSTNEEVRCIQQCPPETTCRTRGIEYDCMEDPKPCEKKCVCKKDHYRNSIGECITNEECDKCNGSHEFFSCGSACDNVCKDLATQNRTNCPIINIVCNPKCYCDNGYARDPSGNCIPDDECCKALQCGCNEEYSCKNKCPPEICQSLVAKYKCVVEPCEKGCHCKSGFLREKLGSPCIPICQCKEMINSTECQKKDECNF